jgi:hypothetical protein
MPNNTRIYHSDESLAIALKSADQAALGILYDKYSPILFRLLQKMTADIIAAEEVLKACFIHIWHTKDTYNPSEERLFMWVFRTAMNTADAVLQKSTSAADADNCICAAWEKPDLVTELIISGHVTQEEAAQKMGITISELRQLLRKEINQSRRS